MLENNIFDKRIYISLIVSYNPYNM